MSDGLSPETTDPILPPVERIAWAAKRALALALRGVRGRNPLVGAVVLDSHGEVLGEGFHAGAGTPHAEVIALEDAGISARGATLVVTLEPCSHTGLTPPCVQAILRYGIGTVIYLSADPSGAGGGAQDLARRGVRMLRWAGGELAASGPQGQDEASALALNAGWFRAFRERRPYVTAKIATTADGFVAALDGSSKWITHEGARADAHRLRARCDAIAVGTGTLLSDDPELSVRLGDDPEGEVPVGGFTDPQPVVFGRTPIPPESKLSARSAWQYSGRDLPEDLRDLKKRGVQHLVIEGGPRLLAAFLRADLVDQLIHYQSTDLLGQGLLGISFTGIDTLERKQRWRPDLSSPSDLVRLEAPAGSALEEDVINYRIQSVRED